MLMQPQAPTPPDPTSYDFILNHNPAKPKRFAPPIHSSSLRGRILIVLGGILLLLVMFIVFSSLLGSGGNTTALVGLAEQQQELIRVADLGANQQQASPATQDLATTAKLSLETTQTETLALLKKNGHKVSPVQLASRKNLSTDQAFTTAAESNTFDTAFTDTLQNELKTYRLSLQSAFKTSTKSSEKKLLQASFNSATLIIGDQTTQTN